MYKIYIYTIILPIFIIPTCTYNNSTLTHTHTDSPPPIGFLPHYLSDPIAASHISGVDLSYGRQPVPNNLVVDLSPTTPETYSGEDDNSGSSTPSEEEHQTPSPHDYSGFDLLGKKIQVFVNLFLTGFY